MQVVFKTGSTIFWTSCCQLQDHHRCGLNWRITPMVEITIFFAITMDWFYTHTASLTPFYQVSSSRLLCSIANQILLGLSSLPSFPVATYTHVHKTIWTLHLLYVLVEWVLTRPLMPNIFPWLCSFNQSSNNIWRCLEEFQSKTPEHISCIPLQYYLSVSKTYDSMSQPHTCPSWMGEMAETKMPYFSCYIYPLYHRFWNM